MYPPDNNIQLKKPETLCELLSHHIQNYKHPDTLNYKANGKWIGISSEEFISRIKLTALGLYSLGVRSGDKIAILSENSPEWVISDFAITFLGAATVPLYITQVASQIEYILNNAGVKVLFVSTKALFDRVKPILHKLYLESIILLTPFESGKNIIEIEQLRKMGENTDREQPELMQKLHCAVKPETVVSVIYTSGTTGEPKGVVLTHRNLTSNAVDSSSTITWDHDRDSAFSFLPLSHIFERTMINIYLYQGVRIYFAESIEQIAQNLREVHPSLMSSVPRLLEKVYDKILEKGAELKGFKKKIFNWSVRLANNYRHNEKMSLWYKFKLKIASALVYKKWREAIGGRLRFIISGGAPLPPKLAQVFMSAGIPVVQGYGLTETSPVIAVNSITKNKIGSVGPLIPNVEVKIADDGEILVRGPNVMKEFYNAPEETEKVFKDGWFCTGDIGLLDEQGFLFVTDRKKDLIKKSSGKFVAPGPIENMLSSDSLMDFAVMIGEGRKFAIALLFPNFTNLKDWASKKNLDYQSIEQLVALSAVETYFQQVVDRVNSKLNPWERIIKFMIIENVPTIDSNELTPTMKVRRRVIESKYKGRIDKLYEKYEHLHDVHFEDYSGSEPKDLNNTKLAS